MISKTLEEMLVIIGKNVQKYRVEQNMTLLDLSQKTGISQNLIKKIENGTWIGSSTIKIIYLSEGLNIKPSDLFK